MKTLRLDHELANLVKNGKIKTTLLYDDKDLSVNDEVELVDEVSTDPALRKVVGRARIREVIQKRLGDLRDNDFEGYAKYQSKDEMITTFRRYYGGRVSDDTPVKILRFEFVPVRNKSVINVVSIPSNITEVNMYADGGSRGNPGPAASGYVIIDKGGKVVVKKGVYLGRGTNNQAEYKSLKFGLENAHELGVERVHVYMDSQLVVRQMQGMYRVKNKDLISIYTEIQMLVKYFKEVTFTHVPRELNKLADAEVNKSLDAAATL